MSDRISTSDGAQQNNQSSALSDFAIGAMKAASGVSGIAADMAVKQASKNSAADIANGALDFAAGGVGSTILDAAREAMGKDDNSKKAADKKDHSKEKNSSNTAEGVGKAVAGAALGVSAGLIGSKAITGAMKGSKAADLAKEAIKAGAGVAGGALDGMLQKDIPGTNLEGKDVAEAAAMGAAAGAATGLIGGAAVVGANLGAKIIKDAAENQLKKNKNNGNGLNLIDEIKSTPADVYNHLKNNPERAIPEAILSPLMLFGDAKLSKDK